MQMGKVFDLKSSKLYSFLSANNILVILVLLLIAGFSLGTFTQSKAAVLSNYSDSYIKYFIAVRTGSSVLSVMVNSFMLSMLFLLIIFVFGTSMLGVMLVPLTVGIKGVMFGSVAAALYSGYAVKGIAFNAVLIMPVSLIFIISILLAARESVKFSLIIAKMSLPKSPYVNLNFDFKNYCGRYIFISVIVLLSAVLDGILSHSFIDKFILA